MPEQVPLNQPWSLFPTPEVADDLIVELVDTVNVQGQYQKLPVGTAQPFSGLFPGYLLVKEEVVSHKKSQRYWSTTYSNQDLYNYDIGYIAESSVHPIFVRRYLVRRDHYTAIPATPTVPVMLTGVFLVKVTNGGTGYVTAVPPAVSFSGGAGSGAAATALVDPSGVVQYIRITNEGSGYTSAPGVTVAPPVSGTTATATSVIQGNTVRLVQQKVSELPSDDPRRSLFLFETRAYKLLPGPDVVSFAPRADGTLLKKIEREVPALTIPVSENSYLLSRVEGKTILEAMQVIEQIVQSDGTTPVNTDAGLTEYFMDHPTNAIGGITVRVRPYGTDQVEAGEVFLTGTVIDYRDKLIEGSDNILQIITWLELPEAWVEYPKVVGDFPGIFKWAPYAISGSYDGRYPPPWPGDGQQTATFYQLYPRQREVQGRVVRSYSIGPSGFATSGYMVYTPGVASRVFRIPNNTVHGPIVVTEITPSGAGPFTVENIPASSPTTYTATQILTYPLGELRYKGIIYERRVLQLSEATSPYNFGPVYSSKTFTDQTANALAGQPNPAGERLVLVSDGADTRVITIYGIRNTTTGVRFFSEAVTLSGATSVQTDATYLWFSILQAHAASTSGTRTVTVRGQGTEAEGAFSISFAPSNAQTMTVGITASPTVYTFVEPGRYIIGFPAAASLNPAGAGSYILISVAGVGHYYWANVASGNTDPAPGGTGHEVVIAGGAADTVVAAAFFAAIQAQAAIWFSEVGGNAVTITSVVLNNTSASQNAAQFTFTVGAVGTAQAAYQVRTGWGVSGVGLTVQTFKAIVSGAINLTGTAGQTYGTGTAQHPDLEASNDPDNTARVILTSRLAKSYGTWTFTETTTGIAVEAITDGANGPLYATLGTNVQDTYDDINFDNTALVLTGSGWDADAVEAYGAIRVNMPASVGQLTSDSLFIGKLSTQAAILRLIASGTPALPISYETSVDNAAWSAGQVTLPSLGNQILYDITLTETTINYIRVKPTNSTVKARAIHIEVFTQVDV